MKTIAVVEDNPDNLMLVQALLEGQYSLDTYENGVSALNGISSHPPDLILMDISLPGMDGVEVMHALRAKPELAHIPIIALTAHSMAGDREKYLEMGFDGYLSKPIVDMDAFLTTIQHHLSAS